MSYKYLYSILLLAFCLNPATAVEMGDPAPETGTIFDLQNGQRMQVLVADLQLQAYFIDADGLIAETNADSIVLVVDDPGHKNHKWRGLLKSDGENGFICQRRLYPPYEFRARIIIRFTDEEPITLAKKAVDLDKPVSQAISDEI